MTSRERRSTRRDLLRGAGVFAAASALAPRAQAAIPTRYPYVQHVLANRCTICWATFEAGIASVQVATDPAFVSPVTVAARARRVEPAESRLERAFTQWEADLTGLNASERYYYRVFLGSERLLPEAAPADLAFRTAPASGGFRFLAFGDSGGNTPEQYALRDLMMREGAAMAVHTGDIAYPFGAHQTYDSYYLQAYRDLMRHIPFYPAVGNHDIEVDQGLPYFAIHSFPVAGVPVRDQKRYYSVDWGDVHFISLDSNLLLDPSHGRPMLEWLIADLQATRKAWKIALWHHTPYDAVRGEEPEARFTRQLVIPVLERFGVQLVFAGHSHIYERSHPLLRHERASGAAGEEGIVYVTTGGAGGGIHDINPAAQGAVSLSDPHYLRVDVEGTRLTVRAIGLGGRELDRFAIAPRPLLGRSSPVNAASLRQPVAPGSLISVFGSHLAPERVAAGGLPLPVELSGVRITLGGRALPLTFVSPEQITAQLPFHSRGEGTLRIGNGNGNIELPLTVQTVAPGIFETASGAAIARADGRLVSSANPASAGETVSVYLTGLGDVAGECEAGSAAPALPVNAEVEVDVAGLRVLPSFAGLAPGQAGVYQVNLPVPAVAAGRHVLAVVANGVRSNDVFIEVA